MSIATRTGDGGTTALMYGRRVSKDSPRVEAYGEVDELNACLGLARAQLVGVHHDLVEKIQKALVGLMGELAVAKEDLSLLDGEIVNLEKDAPQPTGWSTPGGNQAGAALDLARAVCRRAERGVWQLEKKEGNVRTIIPRYLNRLSDLLWLLERKIST